MAKRNFFGAHCAIRRLKAILWASWTRERAFQNGNALATDFAMPSVVAVFQTATLPLGYPAALKVKRIIGCTKMVSIRPAAEWSSGAMD